METNERGALYLHGLMWLHGNMDPSAVFNGAGEEDQVSNRERIIEYVDSVFTEVCLSDKPPPVQYGLFDSGRKSVRISIKRHFALAKRRGQ